MIYKSISPEIVVPSRYIYDLVKESPITKNINNIHIIPLGVDLNFFTNKIDKEEARKKLQISSAWRYCSGFRMEGHKKLLKELVMWWKH